ncbi:Tubby, C-terminal [Dillenia turbinata]|uniref:Tubby, C-terminal n=1 Tax=Dillenia turbinata TaxID=194707 RepID=A0AAN8UEB0_9MAGN
MAMAGLKTSTGRIPRQSSCNSLNLKPLTESKHNRSCSEGDRVSLGVLLSRSNVNDCKENAILVPVPIPSINNNRHDKENAVPNINNSIGLIEKPVLDETPTKMRVSNLNNNPSLLEQRNESNCDLSFGSKIWEPIESEKSNSANIWDYSESEAAPASSWSTVPNRALLCRPLPLDIGRCACMIVKEALPQGLDGGTLYSLYTNEGQGRQDRKLAVAYHKRRNGKSEFTVAQSMKGIFCSSDDGFIGTVTANLMGSKYHIWDQGRPSDSEHKQSKRLLAIILFMPTVVTWTGSYRSMRAWMPKYQSMQLKNTNQHANGLPKDWETRMDKVHQLFSRAPCYNNILKQYELDFRERGRPGMKIQSSVKNFQLTLEENGRQTILQLGRVGKLKYVMEYRFPLTGYQAFCMCLASIDSKLCCAI